MSNQERDRMEHEMALARFGGVQPEGNNRPVPLHLRESSHLVQSLLKGVDGSCSPRAQALRRHRLQKAKDA